MAAVQIAATVVVVVVVVAGSKSVADSTDLVAGEDQSREYLEAQLARRNYLAKRWLAELF